MKTLIAVILDRSGSMSGHESDTIGGVNNFIEEQKKLSDDSAILFVRFDTEYERFRDRVELAKCTPLTAGEYKPRGMTSLLDAVGKTINAMENDWISFKPERAIVVIVTDGEENSSTEFTNAKIKEMIKSREASGKWAFIYLGTDVNAFAEGAKLGVQALNTAGFNKTARGFASTYANVSQTVSHMRFSGSTVAHNLGGKIEDDGSVSKEPAVGGWDVPVSPVVVGAPISDVKANVWQAPAGTATQASTWTPPA
jgi:hypothetical protein